MVSQNERQRLSQQFDRMQARIDRQKDAITRLGLANTEAVAALAEIADMDPGPKARGVWAKELRVVTTRAQRALDSIAVKAAAAVDGDQGESNQDPTEDGDTDREEEHGRD